jgi:FXSXX-COOH protein
MRTLTTRVSADGDRREGRNAGRRFSARYRDGAPPMSARKRETSSAALIDLTLVPLLELTELSEVANPILAACVERLRQEAQGDGEPPAATFDSII